MTIEQLFIRELCDMLETAVEFDQDQWPEAYALVKRAREAIREEPDAPRHDLSRHYTQKPV